MRQLSGTTILSFDDNSLGMVVNGSIDNVGSGVPTTASLFAVGCILTDLSTGIVYRNVGTVAVPVWSENSNMRIAVSLTAAQLLAMYAAPIAVVAVVPGKAIIVDAVEFDITRTSTAFANGGVVNVQYASTANGAGTKIHADIGTSVVTGAAGRTITARIPLVQSDIATASITGIGLFISNATGAFITGTGVATVVVHYHLV